MSFDEVSKQQDNKALTHRVNMIQEANYRLDNAIKTGLDINCRIFGPYPTSEDDLQSTDINKPSSVLNHMDSELERLNNLISKLQLVLDRLNDL